MTEAMPFLQKTILLSYDPRPFAGGFLFWVGARLLHICFLKTATQQNLQKNP